jgi:5-methylcytosine-specific restriction enzyme subunit McrC
MDQTNAHLGDGIPVQNVWYLLLYAWDLAAWKDNWKVDSEESPRLLALLAKVLAQSARRLLRKQLRRSYTRTTSLIHGVRGRIDFATSLKRQTFERGVASCIFPELSIDTLPNRIIRSTLSRLASEPTLTSDKAENEGALRHDLRRLTRQMEGVKLLPITSKDFASLQLGRNDSDYAVPLAICRLIHTLRLPTENVGDTAMVALLRDEITFHKLFERFVRNFFRMHLVNCNVQAERLSWFDELGSANVPSMLTDISIISKAAPFRRMIIDTKYSVSALMETPHGGKKFKSENLYQIYSYLRTQEHLSEAHRSAIGLLLYPTNGYDVRQEMLVQGHRINVATINLAEPWQEIEKHLLALVPA